MNSSARHQHASMRLRRAKCVGTGRQTQSAHRLMTSPSPGRAGESARLGITGLSLDPPKRTHEITLVRGPFSPLEPFTHWGKRHPDGLLTCGDPIEFADASVDSGLAVLRLSELRVTGDKLAAVVAYGMSQMMHNRAVGDPDLSADLAFLQVGEQRSD